MASRRSIIAGAGAVLTTLATGGCVTTQVAGVPQTAITHGRLAIRGKVYPYRAETGETVMRNAAGAPRATIFSVTYLAEGRFDRATRPVTFIFNGGPGGATWPLREAIAPCVFARADTPRGFTFVDNPDSLLDVSDLVFIDAPGTGYSRFLAADAKAEYWGIQQDARAVSQFIVEWLRAHHRMASPKYLLGESYGGTRAGQILEMLALRPEGAIRFSGVTLISPGLGTGTQSIYEPVSNAPVTLVPSEAVAAWYNHRGGHLFRSLEQVAQAAQTFAMGNYSSAVGRSDPLNEADRRTIALELSSFIGISPDVILQSNLTVPIAAFQDLLLADQGERLDGDSREHHPKPSPGVVESVIQDAEGYDLHAAIISMIRDQLGYATNESYVRDPTEAHRMWDNTISSGKVTLPAILKDMTDTDPGFRVLLAGGYFDLVVPYLLPLSALRSAGLPASRLVHRLYPTGHAVLNEQTARAAAVHDVRMFYKARS